MTANLTMWRTECGGSEVWKIMIQARNLIDHQILWHAGKGSYFIWHDNWTELGDLYTITGDNFEWDDNYERIAELATNGEWEVVILKENFQMELVDNILSCIKSPNGVDEQDKPCWILDTKGTFSVKTARNYIRHKEQSNKIHTLIWNKGVLFKMAFIMWRLWKFKIPVEDKIKRWDMDGPSRCWCL
ncbi:hypothetical protein RDI58_025097 [Solanum bulbocastanum]|uniref:Reverse transcriptase zinc-binding domain-containing protein n=1 Tax=Solanum bulbocastanum TaxID=147425 RepID=A0AAN8SZG0_SOLBU